MEDDTRYEWFLLFKNNLQPEKYYKQQVVDKLLISDTLNIKTNFDNFLQVYRVLCQCYRKLEAEVVSTYGHKQGDYNVSWQAV